MAIQDYKAIFMDAQSLATATTSGVELGSAIDLGAAGKDGWGNSLTESPGEGGQLYWNVRVNTGLSAHTARVQLVKAAAIGSSSALTSGVVVQEVAIPASAAAGQTYTVSVAQGGLARYLRLKVVAGNNSLTGALDSWLSNCKSDSEILLK